MRLQGALPAGLRSRVIEEREGRIVLRLASSRDVGAALEACRGMGSEVEDLEVGPADLEDVFLQVMAEAGAPRHERRGA
jgi:hypothetical protein